MYQVRAKWCGFDWKVEKWLGDGSAEYLLATDWGFKQRVSVYEVEGIYVVWTEV